LRIADRFVYRNIGSAALLERDQRKRSYLHPVAGLDAVAIGAGLFLNP
jgi:hypothetical protein